MSLVQRARHQLQLACQVWNRHGCVDLSAAFAFHSLQSFFPFLLVCLGVGARLFGQVDGASDQLLAVAAGVLPPGGLEVMEGILQRLVNQGQVAEQIGGLVLIFSASNATLSLQRGADRLWYGLALPNAGDQAWHWHLRRWFFQRLKAIGAALLLALVLLINQITTPFRLLWSSMWSSLGSLSPWLPQPWEVPARTLISVLGSWLGVVIATVLLFSYLPSRRPRLSLLWQAVLLHMQQTPAHAALHVLGNIVPRVRRVQRLFHFLQPKRRTHPPHTAHVPTNNTTHCFPNPNATHTTQSPPQKHTT
ncbi:MAG: YihY/virulence factor BrkB family protein, partial [Prochlorococcaceae cyanobacterium]